jgi:hypothetical protein
VRVQVAREKHRLEKHQAGIPDRWRSAEHRKDHLRKQRLYPEKQERAAERRGSEKG